MSLYLRINSKHLFFKVRQYIKNDARRNQKEYFKQVMLALSYLKILSIKSTLKGLSDKNEILILKCGFSILFIMKNIMLVIEKNK